MQALETAEKNVRTVTKPYMRYGDAVDFELEMKNKNTKIEDIQQ